MLAGPSVPGEVSSIWLLVIPGAPRWGCLLPWQVSSPASASAWPVHWQGGPRCPWALLAGVLLGPELLVLVVTAATPESLGGVCQFWRTDHFCGLGCGQDWWVLLCVLGSSKLLVGELLEFPDLFVARVDYKYHNFPFCSWVCLLSSINY